MSDQQDSGSSGSAPSTSSSAPSAGCCYQPVNVQQVKSKLANKFQDHKPLVLKLHSILTWEQDLYIGLVIGSISALFVFISLLNSSILATLSYLGMALALLDLALPLIANNLGFSNAKLSDKDNQRFDKILLDVAKVYAFIHSLCATSCNYKTSKPKFYYPALLGCLFVSAYIGNKVNNLFLTYLIVLLVALYPGLEKRGLVQKLVDQVMAALGRRPSAVSQSDRRGSGKKN